jgi:putative redox protein
MKITLNRLDDAFHLEAQNEDGCRLQTDGSPKIGGGNKGMRPMQLLLAAAGSCSSIDVISILRKMKQELTGLQVEVTGDRDGDKVPSLFTAIHIHFILVGKLEEEKVRRAIELSMTKYCSVVKTLEKTAEITSSYEIQTQDNDTTA